MVCGMTFCNSIPFCNAYPSAASKMNRKIITSKHHACKSTGKLRNPCSDRRNNSYSRIVVVFGSHRCGSVLQKLKTRTPLMLKEAAYRYEAMQLSCKHLVLLCQIDQNHILFATLTVRTYVLIVPNCTLQQSMGKTFTY